MEGILHRIDGMYDNDDYNLSCLGLASLDFWGKQSREAPAKIKRWSLGCFFFEKIKTDQGWGKNLALGPFSGWPLVRNVGVNPHHKHVWFHSLIPYWGPPSFGQFLSFWATPKDIWSYVLIDTASSRHVRILNWGCYSFFSGSRDPPQGNTYLWYK